MNNEQEYVVKVGNFYVVGEHPTEEGYELTANPLEAIRVCHTSAVCLVNELSAEGARMIEWVVSL